MGCIKWKARAFKQSTLPGWLLMNDEYKNFINWHEKEKGRRKGQFLLAPSQALPSLGSLRDCHEGELKLTPLRGAMALPKALPQRKRKPLSWVSAERRIKHAPGARVSSPVSGSSPGATRWQPPTAHIFPERFWGLQLSRETSWDRRKLPGVSLDSQHLVFKYTAFNWQNWQLVAP